jgi:hypothetical protein
MTELWATLRDPRVSTVGVLLAGVAAGFTLIWLGYRSSAALGVVAAQMPYLVSGGVIGLAVVGMSLALLSVHIDRAEAAEERRQLARLQREVIGLATHSTS